MEILVLTDPSDVLKHVDTVRQSADTERVALGFLPRGAYEESATRGCLYVAVDGRQRYVGHLLFGRSFPRSKIFQLYVTAQGRKKGVGKAMLACLHATLTAEGFTSISARVAADLETNHFWHQVGYRLIRTISGGKSRGRLINVRVLELQAPGLFALMQAAPGGPRHTLPFSIRAYRSSPIYVLDLNVLLDLTQARQRVHYAGVIVRSALQNFVSLAAAEEIVVELERNSNSRPDDPVLNFARQLPLIPAPSGDQISGIIDVIAEKLFPAKFKGGKLTAREISDSRHLATAIGSSAAGFITSDQTILRHQGFFLDAFGLHCASPEEFAASVGRLENIRNASSSFKDHQGSRTELRSLGRADVDRVQKFLRACFISETQIDQVMPGEQITQGTFAIAAIRDGKPIAYLSSQMRGFAGEVAKAFLCADETAHEVADAVDGLMTLCSANMSCLGPAVLELAIPEGFTLTREIAVSHGFQPQTIGHNAKLLKVAIGAVVGERNWNRVRGSIVRSTKIALPDEIPTYLSPRQPAQLRAVENQIFSIPINILENLFSPVLFLFYNRPCWLVPIRREFSNDLLGTGSQLELLGSPRARIIRERTYFSSERNLRRLSEGAVLLFYESGSSGGRMAVVAAARSTGSMKVLQSALADDVFRGGVVSPDYLSRLVSTKKVTVTTFDNVLALKKPVSFDKLRDLKAVSPANLVAPERIDLNIAAEILSQGGIYE